MTRVRRSADVFLRGALVAVALSWSGIGTAAVWTLTPELSMVGIADTNPQLHPDTPRSGQALYATIGLPLALADDAYEYALRPTLRLGEGFGDSSLGADSYGLTGNLIRKWTHDRLTGQAEVTDDSSVTRQPDAGTLVRSSIRQHRVAGALYWMHDFSTRTRLEVDGNARHIAYGIGPDIGLNDYHYSSIAVQLSHDWFEHFGMQWVVGKSHYSIVESTQQDNSTFWEVGLYGQPRLLWNVTALYGRTRQPGSFVGAPARFGAIYYAAINRTFERGTLSATAVRNLQPSGFGLLVQTTETSAKFDWAYRPRWTASIGIRDVRTAQSFLFYSLPARHFVAPSASATWNYSPKWDVRFDLGRQQLVINPGAASSWGASVSAIRRFSKQVL